MEEELIGQFQLGIGDEKVGQLIVVSSSAGSSRGIGNVPVARSFNTILRRSLKRITWMLRTISCSQRADGLENTANCITTIKALWDEVYTLIRSIGKLKVSLQFGKRLMYTLGALFKAAVMAPEMIDKPITSNLSTLPYETSCTKNVYLRNDTASKRAKVSDKATTQILEGDLILSHADSVIPDFANCAEFPPGARFDFEGVSLTTVSSKTHGSRYQPFAVAVCGACYIRNVTPEAVKPGDLLEVVPNHGTIRLHDESGERRPACTVPYRSKVSIPNLLVLSPALPGGTCCVLVLN